MFARLATWQTRQKKATPTQLQIDSNNKKKKKAHSFGMCETNSSSKAWQLPEWSAMCHGPVKFRPGAGSNYRRP